MGRGLSGRDVRLSRWRLSGPAVYSRRPLLQTAILNSLLKNQRCDQTGMSGPPLAGTQPFIESETGKTRQVAQTFLSVQHFFNRLLSDQPGRSQRSRPTFFDTANCCREGRTMPRPVFSAVAVDGT